MDAYYLHDGHKCHNQFLLLGRKFHLCKMATLASCCESLLRGKQAMKIFLIFHRTIFAVFCVCALLAGITQAALADILAQKEAANLLLYSAQQLVDYQL